jgi:hypothetical protein
MILTIDTNAFEVREVLDAILNRKSELENLREKATVNKVIQMINRRILDLDNFYCELKEEFEDVSSD